LQNWLKKKYDELDKIEGYIKPEKIEGIKLDSNENFVIRNDFIRDILLKVLREIDLREYPLEQFEEFYTQLSKYTKIKKSYLSIGNGSDQIIDLVLSIFGKNNRVTTFTPTFSYFIDRCKLYSITIDQVPLEKNDNSLDKSKFIKSAIKSQIVYICSPNNPTGNQIEKQKVIEIINELDDKLIIIDEAYVEFANYSISHEIIKKNNVIVLRTLSKAFGLAGARLGYCISNEKFSNLFRKVIQSPYPINTISLCIGCEILKNTNYINETIKGIKEERERLYFSLKRLENKIRVFKTDANFIFIQINDSEQYYRLLELLKKEKIIIKAFDKIEGRNGRYIRVTIGTKEMNNRFLKIFRKIYEL